MEKQKFNPEDTVTWQYLLGGKREMFPGLLNVMANTIAMTGSINYPVSRTEKVLEAEQDSVGHHQFVWIINPTTGKEMPNKFSGSHFSKIS